MGTVIALVAPRCGARPRQSRAADRRTRSRVPLGRFYRLEAIPSRLPAIGQLLIRLLPRVAREVIMGDNLTGSSPCHWSHGQAEHHVQLPEMWESLRAID
jgi:hypothetical protein